VKADSQATRRDEAAEEREWAAERAAMVDVVRRHGVRDPRILMALARVPRHHFIPPSQRQHETAYADHPWSIGHGQTISQPYIVAYMTERLHVQVGERVLEIGTGSGYQAAVLAELGATVFTVERVPELAEHARAVLAAEGYADRVRVRVGDGYQGWPEESPYDAILTACAPESVPPVLIGQLGPEGRMMLPVGSVDGLQRLVMVRRHAGHIEQTDDLGVRFVPMVPGPV
jgi:protein-L-isoaspartate(D-aspartate) O-methyltransferase